MDNVMQRNRRFVFLISFVCFLTNIGQSPSLIDNFQTRLIVIPIWIVFAFICILRNHILDIDSSKTLLLLMSYFAVFYFLGSFFINEYSNSNLPYCIFLSVFIFVIGLFAGPDIDWEAIEQISTAFIISSAVVTLDTFITYLYGQSLAGRLYLYDSKNSVSQIILTAWLLILFLKFNNTIPLFKKVFYIGVFALMTMTLVGLKSRATLIALPVVFIWILVHGKMNRKLRNLIIIALIILIVVSLLNPELLNNVVNNVVLGGRNVKDLNDITSGRAVEWLSFMSDFSDRPFFGHGRMKRESLVLTSLLEFGLLGGGSIILIAIYPFYWTLRRVEKHHPIFMLFSSICIAYIINGLFEQLAPFGPGVKCYFLWFLLGVTMSSPLNCGVVKWMREEYE